MILTRRELLIGSVALGTCAALGNRGVIASTGIETELNPASRLLLVLQQRHPGLLSSIQTSQAHVRAWCLGRNTILDPGELRERLAAIDATHVCGLLDPCNRQLLLEIIRDRSGAVLDAAAVGIDYVGGMQPLLAAIKRT
jgi:hypothetical protein